MKKLATLYALAAVLTGCTTLTHQENNTLRALNAHGISVEKPAGYWQAPASPAGAGALNLLPGFGNFYLAWGIPEAAIDANRINERELIYYYTFDESGKEALAERGFIISSAGKLEKIK